MSRCICCNERLTRKEMKLRKPDGTSEDLCGICRPIAISPDSITYNQVHEYQLEHLTSGDVWFERVPRGQV